MENQSNLPGGHIGTPPVVEVVLQVAVSDAELELLQEVGVLHQVQRVEDVKVFLEEKEKRMWQREFSQSSVNLRERYWETGLKCFYKIRS